MNLLNHESKMKLFSDKPSTSINPIGAPKWSQGISDLVKKNHASKFSLNQMGNDAQSYSNNRLVQKLANIHHSQDHSQPGMGMKMAQTAVTGMYLRDQHRRVGLDDGTNAKVGFQNVNPNFPQTVNNIINSNRSGSSQGFMSMKQGNGASTAKAIGQFKFNLTLNRNKHQPNQKSQEHGNAIGAAFYPTQQHPQNYQEHYTNTLDGQHEDQEANFLVQNERQKTLQPRGKSALGQRQQSKFKLVNMVYDDHQPIGVGGAQPMLNQQQIMQDEDFQEDELNFDLEDQENYVQDRKRQSRSQNTRNQNPQVNKVVDYFGQKLGLPVNAAKLNDTNVELIEERQTIFEEEIIKRIKEIQKYSKSLHLSIKKLQSSNGKKTEEWKEIKDQLVKIKDEIGKDEVLNEQAIQEIIDHKLGLFEEKTQQDLQNLESKVLKETEIKINRSTKQQQYELQVHLEAFKEDIIQNLQSDLSQQLKQEMIKLLNERFKESAKLNEKTSQELNNQVATLNLEFEDFKLQSQSQIKDQSLKIEKSIKNIKDQREYLDEQVSQISESVNEQLENMRRRIMKDIKSEYDFKQYASQTDLSDALQQFNSRISLLNEQVNSRPQQIQSKNENLEELISKVQITQEKCQNIEVQNQAFMSKVQSLERQISELLTPQSGVQDTLDLHSEKIQNLQALLEQCQIENQDMTNQLQQFSNQSNERDFKQQLENVKNQIQSEITNLKESNEESLSQINYNFEQFEQKLNEIETAIEDINADKNKPIQPQLNMQLVEDQLTESIMVKVDDKVNKFKSELKEVREQVELVKNGQILNQHQIQDIQTQIDQTHNSIEALESNQNTISQKIQTIEHNQQSSLSSSNKQADQQIQTQIQQLQLDLTQLQDKYDDIAYQIEQNSNLSEDVEQLKSLMNDHQAKIQEYSQLLQEQEENSQVSQQNLQNSIQEISSTQQKQSSNYEQLKNQIENQFDELQSLRETLNSQQQMNQSSQSNFDETLLLQLKENLAIISKDLTMKLDKQIFDQSFNSVEQSIAEQRDQIQDIQSQVTHMDSKFQNMIDEVYESHQSKCEQSDEKINEVQTQLDLIKSQLVENDVNQHIHIQSQPHEEFSSEELELLKYNLSELQNKVQELQQDNDDQFTLIKTQVNELSQQNKPDSSRSSKSQSDEVQKIIQDLNKKLEDKNVNYDKWLNELDENVEKIKQNLEAKIVDIQVKVLEQITEEQIEDIIEAKLQNTNLLAQAQVELEAKVDDISAKIIILEEKSNEDISLLTQDLQNIHSLHDQQQEKFTYICQEYIQEKTDPINERLNSIEAQIIQMKQQQPRVQVPQIDIQSIQKVKAEHQMILPAGLDMSNINSCRSPQNFLEGSAAKNHQQFNENEASLQQNQDYQGHFLENLSDADLSNQSPNKHGNQTSDGDIMMFNNKTQSLGASSIMSNKLHTMFSPVEQKQIMFNQQVSNQLAQQIMGKEEEEKYEDEEEDQEVYVQDSKDVQHKSQQDVENHKYEMQNHFDEQDHDQNSSNEEDQHLDTDQEQRVSQLEYLDDHTADNNQLQESKSNHLLIIDDSNVNDLTQNQQHQQMVSHLEGHDEDHYQEDFDLLGLSDQQDTKQVVENAQHQDHHQINSLSDDNDKSHLSPYHQQPTPSEQTPHQLEELSSPQQQHHESPQEFKQSQEIYEDYEEEAFEEEFIEEAQEQYKPDFSIKAQPLTQAAHPQSQLQQSRYSNISQDDEDNFNGLIGQQEQQRVQNQSQLSNDQQDYDENQYDINDLLDQNHQPSNPLDGNQQVQEQLISYRSDQQDDEEDQEEQEQIIELKHKNEDANQFNANNFILNQNSSEDDEQKFDQEDDHDFNQEAMEDLFEPKQNLSPKQQQQQQPSRQSNFIYQQFDEEESDHQQDEDDEAQFEQHIIKDHNQQQSLMSSQNHGLINSVSNQLFDQESDLYEDESQNQHDEEEEEEEEIVLTADQASDAVAQWIFGDELEMCLEELQILKSRQL
eukprot:403375349